MPGQWSRRGIGICLFVWWECVRAGGVFQAETRRDRPSEIRRELRRLGGIALHPDGAEVCEGVLIYLLQVAMLVILMDGIRT